VQDVVIHLSSTNPFWAMSIQAGVAGEPTRFLATFDPVASPSQMVEQQRGASDPSVEDTLEQFSTSCQHLADVVTGLGEADWDALAESPPGHVPVRLLADHALWDSWVHERDILLPLGLAPVVDDAEVLTCVRYAAALGRTFEACAGASTSAPIELVVTHPDARVVVEVEDGRVRVHDGVAPPGSERAEGDAVSVVEMLSARDAGGAVVPDPIRALTAGLATVFDQPASAL
jgi:hypothetical protein